MRREQTLLDRFKAKYRIDADSGCWVWQGATSRGGYGRHGGGAEAHRVGYELLVGPVPDGLVLDHLCRNRRCVNPGHLEPVSRGENVRRGKIGRAITPAEALAKLHAVGGEANSSVRSIAKPMGTSKSTAHRVLHQLAEAGMVRLSTAKAGTSVAVVKVLGTSKSTVHRLLQAA